MLISNYFFGSIHFVKRLYYVISSRKGYQLPTINHINIVLHFIELNIIKYLTSQNVINYQFLLSIDDNIFNFWMQESDKEEYYIHKRTAAGGYLYLRGQT